MWRGRSGRRDQHFRRRRPGRPFLFRRDRLGARPGEAGTADADAIAQRLAVALHEIEEFVRRIDHDGAGAFLAVILDNLLVVFRIEAALTGIGFQLAVHALRVDGHAAPIKADIGLLLIHLLVAAAARRVAEQEFDEAASHVGGHAHRLSGLRGDGADGGAKDGRARQERGCELL